MESDNELDMRKMVNQQNKKKKKSGGFQSMGLSQPIFRGIVRKGYKVPTPIQRKCIPIIMDGKDVVAMARTGSGKTAAFLIPLFERLRTRSAAAGARALILSPTRELAQQTWKFATEIGKFTDLRAVTIFGGDRMEDQFSAIHEKPDIIIATPGRFLHVVMEMDLKFAAVEYVVFDEADRLFEMGFQDQLQEIINRLPDSRQTLLFSATLPKLLVDFAKAGLRDPTLVRLDVDNKLSDNLKTAFIGCRSEDKTAVLLHILRDVVSVDELTVVFLATKHHVEYMAMVLDKAGISCTYIYSSLDQAARRMNVGDFQRRKARVLLVTDLAARGIDIPLLDNVINYNFPAKSKLFVHRVGRVARAGRYGSAYSLVSPEELPYMMDLQLFLGRTMKYAKLDGSDQDWNGMYGTVPQSVIDDEDELLQFWHSSSVDLVNMKRVCSNAYMQYVKSRPLSSTESVRRMKDDMKLYEIGIHPAFGVVENSLEKEKARILEGMKTYKPTATIFEIASTAKNQAGVIMTKVRQIHSRAVQKHHDKLVEKRAENENRESRQTPKVENNDVQEEYVKEAFSTILVQKKRKSGNPYQVKKKQKTATDFKDKEFYLSYKPADHFAEQGLGLEKSSFEQQASSAVLDFTQDDADQLRKNSLVKKWDRKKKKFVGDGGNEKNGKKIKTESGAWIPASYKSDLYRQWQRKEKSDFQNDDDDDERQQSRQKGKFPSKRGKPTMRNNDPGSNRKSGRPAKRELKTKEEIFKNRKTKAKKQFHSKKQNAKKSKGGGGGGRGGEGGGGRGGRGGGRGGSRGGRGGGGGKRKR